MSQRDLYVLYFILFSYSCNVFVPRAVQKVNIANSWGE